MAQISAVRAEIQKTKYPLSGWVWNPDAPILFLHERPGKDEATPRTIHEAGSNPHSFRPPPPRRQQIPRELQLSGSKSVNYQLNHTTNSDIPSCFHQHTTFVLSAGSPAWQLALPLEQEQSAQYLAGPSTCQAAGAPSHCYFPYSALKKRAGRKYRHSQSWRTMGISVSWFSTQDVGWAFKLV